MKQVDIRHQEQLANLQDQLDYQMVIHDFVKEVLQQDTVEDILWSICNNVISRLGLEDCVIYLIDKERDLLIQEAAYGPKNPIAKEIVSQISIPVGQGVVGTVANTGIAEIIHDTTLDDRYIVDDDFRMSEIAVPIIHNDEVIGVIDSEHSLKNFYNESHLQMLQTVSSLCSTRIGYALAHEELKKHKNQLEVLVNERTKELDFTIEKLRVSNYSLQRYAHMVSHDLKSPLTTISSFVKLIEQTESNLGPKSKEYMVFINKAANRMSNLLEEILDNSTQDDTSAIETLLDLDSILDNAISNLQFELENNNVEIIRKDALPCYVGLESHFMQVFQNLISNSVKYRVNNLPQQIVISSYQNQDTLTLQFKDFGIGVKEEFLESIFDLGERRYFDKDGHGIGLHTCKMLVEHYNGEISANSAGINKGLTISISLPLNKMLEHQ